MINLLLLLKLRKGENGVQNTTPPFLPYSLSLKNHHHLELYTTTTMLPLMFPIQLKQSTVQQLCEDSQTDFIFLYLPDEYRFLLVTDVEPYDDDIYLVISELEVTETGLKTESHPLHPGDIVQYYIIPGDTDS
jgi:hypothetical protein